MDEVELPDGSIIEFPDGSSPGLISTIIRRNSVPGMALYQSINRSQMTHKPEDSFFQSTNPQQAFDNTSESFASGIFNSIPNLSGMVHSLGEFSTGTRQLDTITPAISKAIGADYLNSEFTPESGYQKIVAGVGEAVADPTALIGAPYAAAKYGSKFMKGALDDVLRGGNQRGAVGLSRNGEDVAQSLPMDEASRMGREVDYKGQHSAPEAMGANSLDNMSDIFPDDIYTHGSQYYGTGDNLSDNQSLAVINRMRGNPNGRVTIYRAVPHEKGLQEQVDELVAAKNNYLKRDNIPKGMENGLTGSDWYNDAWDRIAALQARIDDGENSVSDVISINPNDWVTLSRKYAQQHGDSALQGKYKIISKKVKASELHTDGNSINEFGWSGVKKNSANLLAGGAAGR